MTKKQKPKKQKTKNKTKKNRMMKTTAKQKRSRQHVPVVNPRDPVDPVTRSGLPPLVPLLPEVAAAVEMMNALGRQLTRHPLVLPLGRSELQKTNHRSESPEN